MSLKRQSSNQKKIAIYIFAQWQMLIMQEKGPKKVLRWSTYPIKMELKMEPKSGQTSDQKSGLSFETLLYNFGSLSSSFLVLFGYFLGPWAALGTKTGFWRAFWPPGVRFWPPFGTLRGPLLRGLWCLFSIRFSNMFFCRFSLIFHRFWGHFRVTFLILFATCWFYENRAPA